MYIDNNLICELTRALNKINCQDSCQISEGISSCLEVTVSGIWGSVGDRIQEVKWYDVTTTNPNVYAVTYFNRNTQKAVSGITGDNTIPCVDEMPAVVSVNNFPASLTPSTEGEVLQIPSSTSPTVLSEGSEERKGATIFNLSAELLYLKLGENPSTTSFTVVLEENDYYEVPFNYTGDVTGVWAAEDGFAYVTELT